MGALASARFSRLSGPLKGAMFALGAATIFSSVHAVVRYSSAELHPFEIAFFRNFFGAIFLLPWLLRGSLAVLRTRRLGLHVLRTCSGMIAMWCWFSGLSLTPLAEATVLSFTAPLFATLMAPFVLKEVVGVRRYSAVAIGFCGTLIVLLPQLSFAGGQFIQLGAALVLASALVGAISTMFVKLLSRTDHPDAIVTYMMLFSMPISLVPAMFVWVWPSLAQWGWMLVIGGGSAAAHLLFVRAFAVADASFLGPFDYARLPIAALISYLVFATAPGLWTWIGGLVIAAAAIYTAHRENRRRKSGA